MGYLNINSLRNKFESFKYIVDKNVDILLISETKFNDTYPSSQFLIDGVHPPYRKDRTEKGGGLLLLIQDFISSRMINIDFYHALEAMVIEINLKKQVVDYLFI